MDYHVLDWVPQNFGYNNSLHHAVVSKDCSTDLIRSIVRRDPTTLNSLNYSKATPLHCALNVFQRSGIILELLCLGADVNAKEAGNLTPLHIAICRYNKSLFNIVQILVQYGADVNCIDSLLLTPLHYLFKKKEISMKTLHYLLENGADTNATDMFSISVLNAALRSAETTKRVVKLLLDYGAKPTRKDCIYFFKRGSAAVDIAKLILQYIMVDEFIKITDLNCIEELRCYVQYKKFIDRFDEENFYKEIAMFEKSLINELVIMKKFEINKNKTLFLFISDSCFGYSAEWDEKSLLNDVLLGLGSFNFVCSHDLIEASLKRYNLIPILLELDIYANSSDKRIMLNNDVVFYLVLYLSEKDIVNMVLAYWSEKRSKKT